VTGAHLTPSQTGDAAPFGPGDASPLLTPSQTVGPFFAIGLPWPDGPYVVPEGSPGAIVITGRVTDSAGEPVPDALVETWQAAPDGSFAHPDDPREGAPAAAGTGPAGPDPAGPDPAFRGFARCPTGHGGEYRIVTLRPGPLPCGDGRTEAPHLDVSVFARGLLDRLVTRIYFPDEEPANAADPVLSSISERSRRDTLIAAPAGPGEFRFDVRLQGDGETVFFDV
jgi:protocatechuate 3,4-dioxygenase alpha subunit